jgi:site-specific DNA recombinase
VTQQFNTTTSMGRLTLNVLLSFAQFEREVTSERIRDKIAASKRKGLWVGGVVPLGYQAKDRKITVVEKEAKTVRHIFRRYLELGSINLLLADLSATGVKTKVRHLSNGRIIGGIPFGRGALGALLRNRFYIGEVNYRGEIFPGEQPPILDRALFDAVQHKLDQHRSNHNKARHRSGALLAGRIFDDNGNRMTPTYAVKNGVRYRYYLSRPLTQGEPTTAAKLNRVPAADVEKLVIDAVRACLGKRPQSEKATAGADSPPDEQGLIASHVTRVDVRHDHLLLHLSPGPNDQREAEDQRPLLRIPWKKPPSKSPRELIAPAKPFSRQDPRPIRAETRAKLVTAIARGRRWLDELIVGTFTNVEQIAAAHDCTTRQVNMTISLAFLAPALVQAAVDGRLPRGIGVAALRDAPAEWSRQHAMLGLAY